MIKHKHYLTSHNSDGSRKSPATPASGDKRRISELEAILAESESVVKGQEAQLKANREGQDKEPSRENDALVPYGHTCTPFKKERE